MISTDGIIDDILRIQKFNHLRSQLLEIETVLDVGGGSGRIWNINGIVDKSITLIDKDVSNAEDTNPYAHLIHDDVMRASAFANDYDMITAFDVLNRLDDPVGFLASLKGSSAKYIYITVPNANSVHRKIALELGSINHIYELDELDYKAQNRRIYDMKKIVAHFNASKIFDTYALKTFITAGVKIDESFVMDDMETERLFAIQMADSKIFETCDLGADICVLLKNRYM